MSYICVADANIFFSAIMNPAGNNAKILSLYAEKLCTCEFVFQELEKYMPIFQKRDKDPKKFMEMLLSQGMMIYPDIYMQQEAKKLYTIMESIDIKDILYVSLALKLSIPLRTLDKKLLSSDMGIVCVDTGGILEMLQ